MFSVLVPLFGAAVTPFFLGLGFAHRAADVEKHAVCVCGTAKRKGQRGLQKTRSFGILSERPAPNAQVN
jgi:hypothetical protein